jgi:hypothetical protein
MILMLVRESLFEHVFLQVPDLLRLDSSFRTVGLCEGITTIGSASTWGGARFLELEI